ncbi:MAG TPA: CRTAC1 family protein, partial [Verrucomicrobiae bacterium]
MVELMLTFRLDLVRRATAVASANSRCPVRQVLVLALILFLTSSRSTVAAGLEWQPFPGGRVARLAVPATGKTGFTLLPGQRTGLHFTNALDDLLIMQNNNFMEGAGVALGDFDGDGWSDVYFCAIDGTNALYRNLGNWTFEDVTGAAAVEGGGWHSTGAVFADIDGDGDLDLLVNTLGRGTHCFLNLGGSRFREVTEEAGLKSQTGSLSFALADIDGDGALDLYVANYGNLAILRAGGRADMKRVNGQWQLTGPYAERLRFVDGRLEEVGEPDVLYLNDGWGHFKPLPWNSEWFLDEQGKPMPPPWDFGLGVQMRDINEDGFPDIYVCNDFQTVDRIWINDGTGHFRLLPKLAMRHQSFASMGVDFADIDRDGRLDFFVVEMLSREHPRRMTQIGGMQPSFPIPGRFENRPEVARNTLFWNRGDGTYAEIADFSGVEASEWSWQPVFLDLDLDGFEDILVVNGNAFDVQDRDALKQVRALGRQTPEQTRTNILLYPRLETPNMVFRNRGDLTFEEVSRKWGFDSTLISHGIALADLDHDGDLDVVVNCLYSPPLLYRNDSTAPRLAVRLRGKAPNVQGIGAKIRLFGGAVPVQSQEIVCGGRYLSGDDPMRVFAAGTPTNRMRLEVTWRRGTRSMVENVQANCLYEVEEDKSVVSSQLSVAGSTNFAPEATKGQLRTTDEGRQAKLFTDVSSLLKHTHHEEQFDDYARQALLMKQLSQLGPGVAWFDLDGDGHDDLFVGSGKGGQMAAFRGNGRGGFVLVAPTNAAALPDDLTGLAGSVMSSGRRVLMAGMATAESSAAPSVAAWAWELDKLTGQFTKVPVRDLATFDCSPGPLAVADYDGDGSLDVFVGGRFVPGAYPQLATS